MSKRQRAVVVARVGDDYKNYTEAEKRGGEVSALMDVGQYPLSDCSTGRFFGTQKSGLSHFEGAVYTRRSPKRPEPNQPSILLHTDKTPK